MLGMFTKGKIVSVIDGLQIKGQQVIATANEHGVVDPLLR